MPKQPRLTRYKIDTVAARGSKWVRLGRNHYARSGFEATFTPIVDPEAPVVSMTIRIDEDHVPQAFDVGLHSDTPLSPESVRIPLRAMVRAAVACVSYTPEGETSRVIALPGDPFEIGSRVVKPMHADLKHWKAFERDLRRAPANRVTEGELRRTIAIVHSVPYRQRRAAVADALNVSLPVAKSRIAEARRRFPEEFNDHDVEQ